METFLEVKVKAQGGGLSDWAGLCGSHLSLLDMNYPRAEAHGRRKQDRTREPEFQTQEGWNSAWVRIRGPASLTLACHFALLQFPHGDNNSSDLIVL